MKYDYHAHSTYSDGADMTTMVEAAREADLAGIGFADHCNVSTTEPGTGLPHDLHETYPERRRDVEALRETSDLRIFDAVEMDYRPADEDAIDAFLAEAGFDYTVGSVHHVDEVAVMEPAAVADYSEEDRRRFVDRYFDLVVELVDSGLFDVVAHVDVVERNPELRGYATEAQYRRVADALADSRTVPEINAGRVFGEYEEIHPHPDLLATLVDAGVGLVTGTDAHRPEEVRERAAYLSAFLDEHGIEVLDLPV